jgi:regulator of sigma E protease
VSWLLAFAGFAALIILHEFGHFAAAKAVGMRVERFFLFFPPKLISIRRGETEYGIGAIPLGGFVKITGMNPVEELDPSIAHRAYYHQPVWKRIVVIGAGPTMNLLIAFGILFVLAFSAQEITDQVGEIEPGAPAAGRLMPGDEIIAVDGKRGDAEAIAKQIGTHRCAGEPADGCRSETPVQVRVERDGERLTIPVPAFYDAELDRQRLGFTYGTERVDIGAGQAATRSLDFMWEVTHRTVGVVVRIFDPEQREQISGVVGSYEVTRQAIDFDARRALLVIGIISLSLAIINLFPFLPLDGGHVFWSVVEKLRGKAVPFHVMERASVIGFVLILMIFVVGLSNDIDRLTGEGFEFR